jgi:hypothetical protein
LCLLWNSEIRVNTGLVQLIISAIIHNIPNRIKRAVLIVLTYKALQDYRAGRKSLGTLAKDLQMPLSAVLDLLAELGIEAPLDYEDYLESLETLRRME